MKLSGRGRHCRGPSALRSWVVAGAAAVLFTRFLDRLEALAVSVMGSGLHPEGR